MRSCGGLVSHTTGEMKGDWLENGERYSRTPSHQPGFPLYGQGAGLREQEPAQHEEALCAPHAKGFGKNILNPPSPSAPSACIIWGPAMRWAL